MQPESKQYTKTSIAVKLLAAILMVTLLIVGVQAWIVISRAQQQSQTETRQSLLRQLDDYNSEVEVLERASAALSTSFADRDDIKTLLLAENRAGLVQRLRPVFNTLSNRYGIVHLYVHNPDGTVFVRVHNPKQFGDDVTYRRTVAAALATKETVPGVEIGPNRLGVRSVSPLFFEGEFIGMVEVGLDYDQAFLEQLKNEHGVDYRMWVSTDAAAPANLGPAAGAPEVSNSGLFFYATTSQAIPVRGSTYRRVLASGQPEIQFVSSETGQELGVVAAPLYGYGGRIIGVLEIARSRVNEAAGLNSSTLTALGVAGVLLLLGLGLLYGSIRTVVLRPVNRLIDVARRQLHGDLTARAENMPGDEFGELGQVLNSLTKELDETLTNQERTIVERTTHLQLTLEIAHQLSSILNLDQLLPEAVTLVQERFDLYHTHIYLLDQNGGTLVMVEGYGQAGRSMKEQGHRIALNAIKSLVARAARSGRVIRVDNVHNNDTWLPNPLLPETRSEMAVPIKLWDQQIVGVLDVQSAQVAGFDEQITATLAVVADHIALAVHNARRFEETAAALAEAERVQKQYLQSGWQTQLIHQKSTIYQHVQPDAPLVDEMALNQVKRQLAQGQSLVLTSQDAQNGNTQSSLAVPLIVRGQRIGNIRVHDTKEGRRWSADEIALVEAISDQMSLALENARLFEETRRRAGQEKVIADVTRQVWASSEIETVMKTAVAQLGEKLGASEVVIRLDTGNDDDEPVEA